MLEKATQVQSSWPFPVPDSETLPLACFPLFLGLTKLFFFLSNGEKLCSGKQPPPNLIQGWVDPYCPCSCASDPVPTGQFLKCQPKLRESRD